MKTKSLFLFPILAVLFAACEKNPNNTSNINTTEDGGKNTSKKVITVSATNITSSSALLTGQISVEIADNKSIEFGMLISEKESDLISNGERLKGDKLVGQTFSIAANGLFAETTYYYRAYLKLNSMQYEYGDVKSFKTEVGIENGHEWIDLGLPSRLKWATCNVGATTPEGYGDYFAWGETSPKTTYNWSTYKYCKGSDKTQTKYSIDSYWYGNYGYNGFTDGMTILESKDDAAHMNWGGNWRMPTNAELLELYNNCTWTWTDNYNNTGVKGYIVSSKKNSKSIFLPAAGFCSGSSLFDVSFFGEYWTSSLYEDYSSSAYYLHFSKDIYQRGVSENKHSSRYVGHSIRAVCDKK